MSEDMKVCDMIQTKGLTKMYGQTKAVNKVFMHVKKGEIYGFLGLNGAGKTTTLAMILGLVHPTSGEVFIDNTVVQPHHYHLWHKVGYLLHGSYAYLDLTVTENLSLFARLHRIKNKRQIQMMIDWLELGPYQHVKAQHLSLGNQVRLGMARALLHEPELLILDEPVNGLDPAGKRAIRELLLYLSEEKGVTILMSSHLLNELAKIDTTIGMIHQGNLMVERPREQLEK